MGVFNQPQYIKPLLTELHKKNRLWYIIKQINISDPTRLMYFDHSNTVHTDEAWFYLDLVKNTLKLLPNHPVPLPNTTQHKSHIPKLMITVAVSEPTDSFDGKIGILPHGAFIPAPRNSKNRPAGTLEFKAVNLTSEEFQGCQMRMNKDITQTGILDMIMRTKDPQTFTTIQLDNAPAHTGHNTINTLNQYCAENGLEIEYVPQPAQSPDFNVNDLGLFNSLKKRVNHLKAGNDKSLSSLYEAIHKVYDDYPSETISIIFGHLYANYNACLQSDGDNKYKSPHENVRQRFAAGESLNTCCLSFEEYTHRKAELEEWFAVHNAKG